MATPHYERLSFLDNSFLALESANTHMHVAAISVFDAKPLQRDDGGIDIDRVRAFFLSKLKYIPRYRQRLAFVPLERHPVWVDDAHFDLSYHLRHTSLPRPGSEEQLRMLAGRIISQPLDRNRPLWELWVVEGLDEDRFAIISKVHHAMIDGMAGVELMAVAFDVTPSDVIDDAPEWTPRASPSSAQLVGAETGRRMRRILNALKGGVRMGSEEALARGYDLRHRVRAARASLRSGWLTTSSRTPLNGSIGPNRRLAWRRFPLAEIKEIKNELGGTVNDAVLTIVSGAVRSFLIDHRGFDVGAIDYRVMAPVSVRTPGPKATGNQVAMWLVGMPISEPDPLKRYEIIKAETGNLKRTNQALGAATLVQASSGAPATVVSMAARLAANIRPFNMTVTNVPGPQFPLYLMSSQLLSQYAVVPLWQSHGLGVALFSYAGQIDWGLNADWDVVPDLEDFADCVVASQGELLQAARGKATSTSEDALSPKDSIPE